MRIFAQGWSDNKDAPGQRWIVYLKGCNFHCRYCGNPESIHPAPEVLFYRDRVKALAPERCCTRQMECASCTTFECVKVWKHPAFELVGEDIPVPELLAKVEAMRHMIDGVTFGGGEPTLQIDELLEALDGLRAMGVNTAVESNAGTGAYARIVGVVDYLISDLKAGTYEGYRRLTGSGDETVKRNLRLAAEKQKELLIRIPLIPGYNTPLDELEAMRDFLAELRGMRSELKVQTLRLHHAGAVKYRALRRSYTLEDVEPPSVELQQSFDRMLQEAGLTVLDFHRS